MKNLLLVITTALIIVSRPISAAGLFEQAPNSQVNLKNTNLAVGQTTELTITAPAYCNPRVSVDDSDVLMVSRNFMPGLSWSGTTETNKSHTFTLTAKKPGEVTVSVISAGPGCIEKEYTINVR